MLADKDSIVTVPFRAFLSNGTAPDTGLSNDSIRGSANGAAQFTLTNKVSAVSANAGMYAIVTTASETSNLGTLALWYDQGDFPQHIANIEVVNANPYSMMSNIAVKMYSGVTFGSLATLVAFDYSSVVTVGVGNVNKSVGAISGLSFAPIPGDYGSTVTVGVSAIKAATYSGVTVETQGGSFSLAPGVYSDVTVQINGIAPGSYSGVSIDGVTRVNSSVTIANAEYSGVTVRTSVLSGHTPQTGDAFARLGAPAGASVSADVAAIKADTAAILVDTAEIGAAGAGLTALASASNLATVDTVVDAIKVKTDQMVYTVANRLDATINSGVTVATGGIIAASFGAGAIDAVALATDAGQEFADRLLLRNIASGSDGGRSVAEALYPLRNRVAIDGSIGTVYQVNDTSSAWTFSVATVSTNSGLINSIDPG